MATALTPPKPEGVDLRDFNSSGGESRVRSGSRPPTSAGSFQGDGRRDPAAGQRPSGDDQAEQSRSAGGVPGHGLHRGHQRSADPCAEDVAEGHRLRLVVE